MFLNTNLIKDSVLSKNIITESINPILQIDQRLESIKLEKERKLQEQVAMIFKDRNYYKRFQEAVLPKSPPMTDEEIQEKAARDKIEADEDRRNARQMKFGLKMAVGSGFMGTAGALLAKNIAGQYGRL